MRAALPAALALALLAGLFSGAHASHYRYGQVSWTRISGNTVEFKVRSGWRCDAPNVRQSQLDFGDGQMSDEPEIGVNTVMIDTGQLCDAGCWAVYEFTTTHTYATEGPYTAFYDAGCLIPTQNAGCITGNLEAIIDLRGGNQGSPLVTLDPLVLLNISATNTIPIPMTEPDGDAITCRFATPAESNIPAIPSYPSAPLMLSGCDLNWDTSAASNDQLWSVQVIVEETHAGNLSTTPVLFLMQICDGVRPECAGTPLAIETVDIGEMYTWNFQGTDADGDPLTVTLDAPGLPCVLTPPSGTVGTSPMNVTLDCAPTDANAGAAYPVSVVFDDGTGWSDRCDFLIKVRNCHPAPYDLISWYPMDESSSPAADVVSGIDATWGAPLSGVDPPLSTPNGIVDGAYVFGQSGLPPAAGIRAPKHPLHDFGTDGDFSIDAWVRPVGDGNSGSGLLPIVWKQWGYFLLLHEVGVNDWRLAYDSGTWTLPFYLTPEVISNSAGTVPFNEWSHVAVTIQRSPSLGTFYVNGQPAGTFDPSLLFNTNYTAPQPLRIGFSNTVSHSPIWFEGEIDEVEIFRRALEASEIAELVNWVHASGDSMPLGKCKETCHIPPVTAYGKDDLSVTVPLTICSLLPGVQQYEVTVMGLPGAGGSLGTGCNVMGPIFTDISISPSNPISVPSGGCTPVAITIDRPAQLTVEGTTACYKVRVRNLATNKFFECWSTLKVVGELGPEAGGTQAGQVVGANGNVAFKLRGAVEDEQIVVRMRALNADGFADSAAVELDGFAAGTVLTDSLEIAQGDSAVVSVPYVLTGHYPLQFFNIVLETDVTGDGTWEPIASTGVRSAPNIPVVDVPLVPLPRASGTTLHALPNPFTGSTTLEFRLAADGPARVDVYDISGQRVRVLMDRALPRGVHRIDWDGRGDGGRELPNGTYFLNLVGPGIRQTGKVVLLR